MIRCNAQILVVLWSAFVVASCSSTSEDQQSGPTSQVPTAAFSSRFELIDTITLEQPDSLPIVRISGVDRGPGGMIVLSDPSEGSVKMFAPDGSLVRIIGRKGRGPGEFQAPEFAQFDTGGRIHVLDNPLQRISVFTPDGRLVRLVSTREFLRITDLLVTAHGDYLVGGFRRGGTPNILFHLDSLGTVRSSHVPLASFIPRGERNVPIWASVRRPSVARAGEQVNVVLSIADSLWTVDLGQGTVRPQPVAIPDYKAPYAISPAQVRGVADILDWSKSFSTTAAVLSTDGFLLVPFVRGVMNEGDSLTVALRDRDGTWTALSGSPPLLRAAHGEVIGLHTPGAERVVLARYRRQR